jgi:hypothetical protein
MALVGILIAVAIIAVAIVFLYGNKAKTPAPTRPGGPTTTLGQSMEKGTEVACMNNLRQIRAAISMEKLSDPESAAPPPNLTVLKRDGVTQDMLSCPVTHQPYQYNPATGQVWCTTPGHEKF